MTGDPLRLLHDPATAAVLRRDLGVASDPTAGGAAYDVDAGLARLQSSLANNMAQGTGAAAGASSGFAVGALVLAGGLAALLGWQIAGPTAAPEPLSVARGERVARAVTTPTVVPTAVVPTMPPIVERPAEQPQVEDVIAVTDEPLARSTRPRKLRGASTEAAGDRSSDYLREARELNAARGFLGVDAARALKLAQAGAAEFRAGTFAQEWEGVAVLALFELGRLDEARTRAGAFLERHPNGTYAPRIRQAIDAKR